MSEDVIRTVVRGVVKGLDIDGAPKVAIKERTDEQGKTAYLADCQDCPWYCHEEPHSRESTAVRHGVQHDCDVAKLDNYLPGPKGR